MGHTGTLDTAEARPVRVELLVIDLMNRLLDPGPDGIDVALQDVLGRLGQAFGLDRTFLFRNRPDGTHYNSHEWVAPGVTSLKPDMQSLTPTIRASWHAAFAQGRVVRIANREDLPRDMAERRFMEEVGVWSTLMLPLKQGDRLLGVIGYDSQIRDRAWSDDEVDLLSSVGRAILAVLARDEASAAEAAVRSHLQTTLSALPDLVVEICPNGTLKACHSDKLPWLSSLVHAGLGRPLTEVLPGPLAEALTSMLNDPRGPQTTRTRRMALSSLVAPHWYEVSVAPLPAKVSGEPVGVLAVIRDLATTSATSEMASYREGQFTAFFEMCPHPILLNDFDTGELLDGNHAFKQVFGIDPQSRPGQHVRDILPDDAAWVIELAIQALKARQRYGPVEAVLRRADGSRFSAVLRGFMSIDPNGRRLVWALIEDVTDIRAKEAALVAERQDLETMRARLVAAIEALDDGFAIFDANDELVLWNQPYTRIFAGIADKIVPGALYDDLLRAAIDRGIFGTESERDNLGLQRRLHRPLTEIWDGEDALADGRLIWVRERATPDRETVGLYEDVTARRLADRRLQQVVDGGEIALWEWESDTGLSTINDRWRTMLGYQQTDVRPPDLFALVHHQDVQPVLDLQHALFQGQTEDFDFLCRLRHVDGHWVWVLVRGRVLARRIDGAPKRMSGITLDVSARIEAEQRLSRLIDGAKVGTWEHDLRSGVTLVNDRWAEILGYRAADLNPMPLERWLDLLHPEDAPGLFQHEARAFASGEWQIEHEIRLRHRQGHWVWVLSRTQAFEWDATGKPVRTSGVNLDISSAKSLEQALARERDTLARIMETSVSGIVAVDGAGRVVFANAAAEGVLGRPVSEGEDLGQIFAAARVADLADCPLPVDELPVRRALDGLSGLHDMRYAIQRPDGARRVLSVNAARLSDPGTDLAVVFSLTDMTDAVEHENLLRAAMTAAEAANRAKSDFLAAMSHEMRTPLNGVLGMAQVMERQTLDPAQQTMLKIIRESGEYLLTVINDILDLAKIEAGRLTLEPRPFHLCTVTEKVLAVHRIAASEKGIGLRLECPDDPHQGWRLGDPQRLSQILHNLVGNAVKFTDHGEVVLRLDIASEERLAIEVLDTGPGLAEAELQAVFEEFRQGQGGIARRHGGTGLGLTIVRRLAGLMDGSITLRNVPGKGLLARVDLHLPRQDQPDDATRLEELPILAGLRVLAAEDTATNRIILDGMLRGMGIRADICADGASALARWGEAAYDAVLLDIAMPGMDGFATLAAMKDLALTRGRAAPVAFAVTANAMTHQVQDYLAQGFAGVVAKPIASADLARVLASCLRPG
ncbi:MAG: PAS domain S-box protein [Tabrizicola sp.]|jgi:PAS domain S-box-containing protein|nr:PAS domain S-box protein [Tabrizicola sp.]